jgi:pSer/pThr/pTyr-binding forkhead associated (FHA) protein
MSCVMCGYTADKPLTKTTETPPKRRQRAETLPKGSLASTVDVESAVSIEQVLVGFVAVYVGGRPAGLFWPVYSGETNFGRLGGGAQNEVGLNAPSVSARHAKIVANPVTGDFVLHDNGSRNGTELNGVKLEPGEAKPLSDDDTIKMGHVTLVLKLLPRL